MWHSRSPNKDAVGIFNASAILSIVSAEGNLSAASQEDLAHYELSGGGLGIHWDSLDEDLYVPNLLLGITDVNRMMKRA